MRECTDQLIGLAKSRQVATVLVGHVTKDGALAGPRALEHMVDTVLSFEGDRHHALRMLRAVKHRFGPTGELGLFEMGDQGLDRVDDPGRLLLGDRLHRSARRCGPPRPAGPADPGGRGAGAGGPHGPDPGRRRWSAWTVAAWR